MPINYDELMQAKSTDIAVSYGDARPMLYALGIGFMRDPMNEDELKFVYENDLQTVPTMATVLGFARAPRWRAPASITCWWCMASSASPCTSRCPTPPTSHSTSA